jgi:hypothetical protein
MVDYTAACYAREDREQVSNDLLLAELREDFPSLNLPRINQPKNDEHQESQTDPQNYRV